MPTPATADVEFQAEEALLRLLASENPGENDTFPVEYRHDDDITHMDDKGHYTTMTSSRWASWIIVKASESEELSPGSGVWIVTISVNLHVNPFDLTEQTVREIWNRTLQVLSWDNLAERLSELDDFHCYGVVRDNPRQKQSEDQTRLKSFKYTCHCMPMNHA